MNDIDQWKMFEDMLKYHDWYYQYSDDLSAWNARLLLPHQRVLDMKTALSKIDKDRTDTLYNKYFPYAKNK